MILPFQHIYSHPDHHKPISDAKPSTQPAIQWPKDPKHRSAMMDDIKLGREIAAEIDQNAKFSENKEYIKRVESIGAELAKIACNNLFHVLWGDKRLNPFQYRFKVIKDKDVNAFSLPGGFIYVHEGLLKFTETDHELAGVLAHEISHAAFRHSAYMRKQQAKALLPTIPLMIAGMLVKSPQLGGALSGIGTAGSLAGTAFASQWSQQAERAADYGAIQILKLSKKYDPTAILTFQERLAKQKVQFANLGIYRTHPPSKERADSALKNLKAEKLPVRRSIVTTSLRVTNRENKEKNFDIYFLKQKLFTFTGTNAKSRAEEATKKLNEFLDSSPSMFNVKLDQNVIQGRYKKLFEIKQSDADHLKLSISESKKRALDKIKAAVYNLSFRTWHGTTS